MHADKSAKIDRAGVPPVRRVGRPDAQGSELLDHTILEAATRLFTDRGYAATSMEQIAAAAGAGKQTIYRRYPSKEHLFTAVVHELSRKLREFAARAEQETTDPLGRLRAICGEMLEVVGNMDSMAAYRILIAEANSFPKTVDSVMKQSINPIDNSLRRLITAARDAGQIRADCPVEATFHALVGLVTGWFVRRGLIGPKPRSTAAERAAFFEMAWIIFLRGTTPGSAG